jgi:hypothetical protein
MTADYDTVASARLDNRGQHGVCWGFTSLSDSGIVIPLPALYGE